MAANFPEKPIMPKSLTPAALTQLLQQHWNLTPTDISPLPGEIDANFAVHAATGQRYGLKIHAGAVDAELEMQLALLHHVFEHAPHLPLQTLVATPDGRESVALDLPGAADQIAQARLCRWLDGEVWAKIDTVPLLAVTELGATLGQLDAVLKQFDHPAAHRAHRWDSERFAELQPCIELVADPAKQAALTALQARFASEILPRLAACPQQVIHSDANDYNLLLDEQHHFAGLLDFGDAIYTRRLFEVANACAYVIDRMADPVEVIAELTAAYHENNPLQEAEIDLIFDAVQVRLGMSMSLAARQILQWPDNTYLLISQQAVWHNWQRLLAENRVMALARIRARCALAPVPKAEQAERWLRRHGGTAQPIFAIDWPKQRLQRLDWRGTAGNGAPGSTGQPAHSAEQLMADTLAALGDAIGIGAFGEDRAVYTGDNYATGIVGERRNRHLGMDVFLPAATPLFAPFDGVVECCGIEPTGFGGLLLLRHDMSDNGQNVRFWTLFGHLNPASLPWQVGQRVAAGSRIGELGDETVNGGWAPHLHLQLMGDLLGTPGMDWPGACSARLWPVYGKVCLPPNLLLGLPVENQDRHESTAQALARERRTRLGPSLSLNHREPLHIVRGEGCYLIDASGKRYLDMVNNVAHVGHANPRVAAAAAKQQALLNTNTRYLHEHILDYARRLTLTMPPELSCVFMVNSGSEANDLALRLARAYTGSREVICVDHAYHGNLTSLIDVSPYKFNGKGGSGQPAHTHIAQAPDLYRGPWRYADLEGGQAVGQHYAQSVAQICQNLQQQQKKPGLFLVEAIQGCAGQMPLPPGYLQAVYPLVRQAGGVVMSDEVQVGFGRVGSHMWAFETQGVVPDIVTMGKPIGNGHPMAAVVTRPEIAAAFANGMEYFNTFGGNPVSCAIGLAVLDEIEEQHLMARAASTGQRLMDGVKNLARRFEVIGDVRGIGMYIGIELVLNRSTQAAAPAQTAQLLELMKQKQVLLSSEGPLGNVLKIKPPLVFGETECDYFLTALEASLGELVY
jgi:4-aminobutyrate aminotransferase-like enzyme/Ser/Thr protein kinase RdoA (MazF antagonist)